MNTARRGEPPSTKQVSHCHSKYQNRGKPASKKRSYTMPFQVSKLIWEPPSDNCQFHKHPAGKYTIHCPNKFICTMTHWKTHVPWHDKLHSEISALQQQSHPPNTGTALLFSSHTQKELFWCDSHGQQIREHIFVRLMRSINSWAHGLHSICH